MAAKIVDKPEVSKGVALTYGGIAAFTAGLIAFLVYAGLSTPMGLMGIIASIGLTFVEAVMLLILRSLYRTRYILTDEDLIIKTTRLIGGDKRIPLKTIKSVEKTLIPFGIRLFGASFHGGYYHIPGLGRAFLVITNLKRTLKRMGVKIMFNTKVKGIKTDGETAKGVVLENNKEIDSDYVVVAPGRSGAKWFSQEIKRLGVEAEHNPVDLGLRVEVPKVVLEPVTEIVWDPKFHIMTKTYDDFVRTFCVNHGGYVINEVYEDFVSVNGHTMKDNKSENSNFALLVRVKLTEPVQDAAEYGRAIARSVTNIGGGKPIIQRLGDLLNGRRSTWSRIRRSYVRPTLRDVTPGDIAMAMPYRFVTDIVESIERLDYVIPGVAADSTLLYAIEIKEYSMRVKVNQGMETNIKNLYAVGDGAGISRNIVIAASTGILAARSILEKEGHVWEPNLPKRN